MGSIFDDDNYVGCNNVGHQLVFILGYKHNGDLGGSWSSCVGFGFGSNPTCINHSINMPYVLG
jgi:hypothetical protein